MSGQGYQEEPIYEIIQGEKVAAASPNWRHQELVDDLLMALRLALKRDRFRVITGVELRLSEDYRPIPDLCVLSKEKVKKRKGDFIDQIPDLVVEVGSDSTRKRDLSDKVEFYAFYKVPEYLLIDPYQDEIRLFRLADNTTKYEEIPPDPKGRFWLQSLGLFLFWQPTEEGTVSIGVSSS